MSQSSLHILHFVQFEKNVALAFLDFRHFEGVVRADQLVQAELGFIGAGVLGGEQVR